MKGWGLRCLTDIPQGSFICVYAGHLLPDHLANEVRRAAFFKNWYFGLLISLYCVQEGKNYGDEYLADLDYIEVVENLKYGYESDVEEDLDDDSNDEGINRNDA